MPLQEIPLICDNALSKSLASHIAHTLEFLLHLANSGDKADHLIGVSVKALDLLAKIHQPAAFCIDWHAACSRFPNRCFHSRVSDQLMKKHLWKPTAEDQTIDVRNAGIPERTKINKLCALPFKRFETGRIIKRKSFIPRHADAYIFNLEFCFAFLDFQQRSLSCHVQDCLCIYPFSSSFPHVLNERLRFNFRHGSKAQMTLRCLQCIVPVESPQYRHMDLLHDLAHHRFMSVCAQTIQDDPCDMDIRIIFPKAKRRRSDAVTHRFAVEYQHHRCLEFLCDIRRRTDAIRTTIIEPHDSFDNGNIRPFRQRGKCRYQSVRRCHPGIQIIGISPGRLSMKSGINIVRTYFERLYSISLGMKIS